jgi:hypothetical protein
MLYFNGGANGVHNAREFCQHAIPHQFYDPAMMFGDL